MSPDDPFHDYFQIVERYFGAFAKEAIRANVTPRVIAADFLSNAGRRRAFRARVPEIQNAVIDFWSRNAEQVLDRQQKLAGVRARFGGDFGPQFSDHVLERSGLYFDTVVVPDPLLRIASLPPSFVNKDWYFVRYGITQALYRDLYQSDVSPPIALLTPDKELVDKASFAELSAVAESDTVLLVNRLYDQSFDSVADTRDWLARFGSAENALRELREPELLYFDEDTESDPAAQLEATRSIIRRDYDPDQLPDQSSATFLLWLLQSRFMQVGDVLRRSIESASHPLLAAPVSFHWLKTKIEVNQAALGSIAQMPAGLALEETNALLQRSLDWLGVTTPGDLISLRRDGVLNEMRGLLRAELTNLARVTIASPADLAREIDHRLSQELARHQARLAEMGRELRGNLLSEGTTVTIAVGAAMAPALGVPLPTWVAGVLGVGSVKKIYTTLRDYLRAKGELTRSPVGILWSTKTRWEGQEP